MSKMEFETNFKLTDEGKSAKSRNGTMIYVEPVPNSIILTREELEKLFTKVILKDRELLRQNNFLNKAYLPSSRHTAKHFISSLVNQTNG
jgi:hypothetical protein